VSYRLPNDDTTRVSSFGYDLQYMQPDGHGGYRLATRFPLEELLNGCGADFAPISGFFKAD